MNIKVYTFVATNPEEQDPCVPEVFTSRGEAEAAAEKTLRAEWEVNSPLDDEDQALSYPGTWAEANEYLRDNVEGWGAYDLFEHWVELEEPAPAPRRISGLRKWLGAVWPRRHCSKVQLRRKFRAIFDIELTDLDAVERAAAAKQYDVPEYQLTNLIEIGHGDMAYAMSNITPDVVERALYDAELDVKVTGLELVASRWSDELQEIS